MGLGLALSLACGGQETGTLPSQPPTPIPTIPPVPVPPGAPLSIVGDVANVTDRLLNEIALRGELAYTGTSPRSSSITCSTADPCTTVLRVWDLRPEVPRPILDVPLDGAFAGDTAVSDDGRLLMVPTEASTTAAGIYLFDLSNPAEPRQVGRFIPPGTTSGVHTAKFGRVGGVLYAFLAANRGSVPGGPLVASRLIILDVSDPQRPTQVAALPFGEPVSSTPPEGQNVLIHDVFVRDGLLFTAGWDGGLSIWDIGGGGRGGSVSRPVLLGNVRTLGGHVHNVWWYHDAQGAKRYAFVGQEGPSTASGHGDVHVVDVSNLAAPREVAFYNVPGGGCHNFGMDEARGILYSAYYEAGVRAIDVRGDLSTCSAAQRAGDGRCDLRAMGRERAAQGFPGRLVSVWGVALQGPYLYASDRLNGVWRLTAFTD